GLTLSGRGLKIMPSDNIAMLRALARDPLVIHETRIDTIYGVVDLMDAALASAPLLDVPGLAMYGAKDEIVPKVPIRLFVGSLPGAIRILSTAIADLPTAGRCSGDRRPYAGPCSRSW